ncbi:hypothetical protein ES702_01929 [subsurface metagenome]
MNQISPYLGFVSRFNKDLLEFLRRRPDVDLEALDHATEERTYPLDKARDNQVIHNRSGDRIFVMSATGYAYIRFNSISKPKYLIRAGGRISHPFKKIFLTNEAQPGKKISIIIGYEAFIEFASPYSTIKMLNTVGIEISPATEDKQDTILTEVQKITVPVSNYDSSTGAPLSVTLEVGHRRFIEVWIKSSAAAIFKVYGKREDGVWRECDEIELSGAGELNGGYWNSKKYVKVETSDPNDNEIEIVGS